MIDIDRLRADVRAHADRIAVALLGDEYDHTGAELRFGRKGSMSVVVTGSKAGTWYDHQCREGGDLLDLIMRECDCDFVPACEIAGELLGRATTCHRTENKKSSATFWCRNTTRSAQPSKSGRIERSRSMAKRCRSVARSARDICARRGASIDALPNLDHVLRFHPSCPFKPMRRHPCLLALYRNIVTDEPRAILRIATDSDLTKSECCRLGRRAAQRSNCLPMMK